MILRTAALRFLLLLLFITTAQTFAYESISKEIRAQIEPYLIPDNHPAKKVLDEIFQNSRAIANEKSLKKAGFLTKKRRFEHQALIASHPKLKKYLLKLVLDSQIGANDAHLCLGRIKGANIIREGIKKHKFEHLFKVPKKWIYLLPTDPAPPKGYDRKHMILVVERMDIFTSKVNWSRWQSSSHTTKEKLKALYTMLSTYGLIDSIHIDNIPYCTDSRIAFVDTEHYERWPVHYRSISKFLSPSRREYWENLITE